MKRNRRGWLYLLLAVLIMCITLGYAYLNTELQINGTTNVSSANWNIYWDNIQFGNSNVTDVTTPATIQTGNTEVVFNVNFKEPGDTYEFTVDAVNDGTIDAMISTFSKGVYASNGSTPKTLPDYLEYTVTYSDGVTISQNHLLEAGETETYKVRVHYKEDISSSQLPSTADNFVFKFSVTYVQADSNAVPVVHPAFDEATPWEDVIEGIQDGTITPTVGDTKCVALDGFTTTNDNGCDNGEFLVRIANTTTPAECSTTGFSQTACGLVLEFADIITTHVMNSTNTNVGGWPASEMRTYVNSDIYNALPTALKDAIIDTTVVSGHGSKSGETNFTSTDKLYLLSPMEVWGNNLYSQYDSARDLSRQMDYYSNLGVNNSSYSGAIKQHNGKNSNWWLRSAYSTNTAYFYYVYYIGVYDYITANFTYSVSPAFRLR